LISFYFGPVVNRLLPLDKDCTSRRKQVNDNQI